MRGSIADVEKIRGRALSGAGQYTRHEQSWDSHEQRTLTYGDWRVGFAKDRPWPLQRMIVPGKHTAM